MVARLLKCSLCEGSDILTVVYRIGFGAVSIVTYSQLYYLFYKPIYPWMSMFVKSLDLLSKCNRYYIQYEALHSNYIENKQIFLPKEFSFI